MKKHTKKKGKLTIELSPVTPEEFDKATSDMLKAFDTTLAGINDKLDEVVDMLQGIRSETTKRGFWQ